MSRLAVPHWISHNGNEPESAVDTLLLRIRQRLYPETLPVLASCWLKTLCSHNHSRAWWLQLKATVDRTIPQEPPGTLTREVLLNVREWTEGALLAGREIPSIPHPIDAPYRPIPQERIVPYLCRLLNEWLPGQLAALLVEEEQSGRPPEPGIPVLAVAKTLYRMLVRERLSPETLEMFLAPELLSPKLVYPADLEILRDVVLGLLGRISADPLPVMPFVLLGCAPDAALPTVFEDCLTSASLERVDGHEEIHVPLTDADAIQILTHDPVRIGSVLVTMDGRAWQPWRLDRGNRNLIVYTPGERLRIDFTADHAKLTTPWPERPSSWPGAPPERGPFQLFGREWHTASWEMDGESTLLHLTFSRTLPIVEAQRRADAGEHSNPAFIDMGWSELESALAQSVLHNSLDPIERMRRAELIPLGRALYALAESVHGSWLLLAKELDTRLRAARYHAAGVALVYGRAPWRIFPTAVQARLSKKRLNPASLELLADIFSELPPSLTPHRSDVPYRAA